MTDAAATDRLAARLQTLSLRQLRWVVALADHAGFSRAAAHLAVSQPALSAAIRQVEGLLDLRLFDRTTQHVAPTEAARAILPHARRLLATANHAFADMAEAARRQRSVVRIGAIPSAVPALAAELNTLAREGDAGLEVHVSDGKSDALIESVRSGNLDLAVCVHPLDETAFDTAPLMRDAMLLLVGTGHPLAAEPALPWRALHGCEVVHFGGGSIGELAAAAMRHSNLSPSPRYRVDQADSLYGLVRAGLAVGIMPQLYTMGLGWSDVALIPLVEPVVTRRIVLLRRAALCAEYPEGAALGDRLKGRLCSAMGGLRKQQ